MRLPKIKFKKIGNFFSKLPRILADRAFLTFIVFFFFSIIFNCFIAYNYVVLAKSDSGGVAEEKTIKFREKTYQGILNVWQEREKNFEATDVKQYSNPFQETRGEVPEIPSETTPPAEEEINEEPAQESLPGDLEKLLTAENLTEFYLLKGEKMPSEAERATLWEEKGLGPAWQYYGSKYQNEILLATLKKELTE